MGIGLFIGSFDPFTTGHESVARIGAKLFDKLYVVVGVNPDKKSMFFPEIRAKFIDKCLCDLDNVEVRQWGGLTVDLCNEVGADYIIKGCRNSVDFTYEKDIADFNRELSPGVQTLIIPTEQNLAGVSSSKVRTLLKYGRPLTGFVNPLISEDVQGWYERIK